MITLATLPTATAQQVFDQIAKHLLTQMKKSTAMDNFDKCQYRSETLRCAAGCLIADEEYKPEMENKSWHVLVAKGFVPNDHDDLIRKMQVIHDCMPIDKWRSDLAEIANEFNLDKSVLGNY